MKFVCDLHLHSKYSRAVSQQMVLSQMAHWAKLKGISVVATADFTHPFWFDKIKNELEEAGNGLCRLKSASDKSQVISDKSNVSQEIYFLLSCEVSSIYTQGGKGRRIHNLFFFPSLGSVEKFNKELLKRGANLRSDGRPIVGINSRDLCEMALNIDKKALVIPAHAWTPWFSVFGAFSGFDSLEECFGDMTDNVFAIETGLSSDPAMNWQIEELENRAIISFSDAHSLEKIGREATVFEAEEVSYENIYKAIVGKWEVGGEKPFGSELFESEPQSRGPQGRRLDNEVRSEKSKISLQSEANPASHISPRISFTIEFYPEEGKYHFTGHRDCNYSQNPQETVQKGNLCPVCGKPLTIGVLHRVQELAAREISNFKYPAKGEARQRQQISNGVRWVYSDDPARPPYVSLVPLSEILAEALSVGVGTKTALDQYFKLIDNLGSEFNVLLKADLAEISRYSSAKVAEGIKKVRGGDIVVEPGYDGKFGVVRIWSETKEDVEKNVEEEKGEGQLDLFV